MVTTDAETRGWPQLPSSPIPTGAFERSPGLRKGIPLIAPAAGSVPQPPRKATRMLLAPGSEDLCNAHSTDAGGAGAPGDLAGGEGFATMAAGSVVTSMRIVVRLILLRRPSRR